MYWTWMGGSLGVLDMDGGQFGCIGALTCVSIHKLESVFGFIIIINNNNKDLI